MKSCVINEGTQSTQLHKKITMSQVYISAYGKFDLYHMVMVMVIFYDLIFFQLLMWCSMTFFFNFINVILKKAIGLFIKYS